MINHSFILPSGVKIVRKYTSLSLGILLDIVDVLAFSEVDLLLGLTVYLVHPTMVEFVKYHNACG